MLLLTNLKKQILFLSYAYYGTCHDYTMLKEEFNPEQGLWFDEHRLAVKEFAQHTPPEQGLWFDEHHLYVDLGFLGIGKDYSEQVHIPHKRSKKKELSEEQKEQNRQTSKIRIKVEHSIGGIKRYRILSDRLRIRSIIRYNQIAGICAGIWNFNLTG